MLYNIHVISALQKTWRPGAPVDVPGEQPGLVSWRFNGVENGSVQLGSSQVDQEDSPGVVGK